MTTDEPRHRDREHPAAYLGYRTTRLLETHATVAQGRTTATLVVLIASLWTLMILARPIAGWKLALVVAMIGAAAVIVAVSPLGHGIFLLRSVTRVLTAAVFGVAGAVLVELAYRAVVRPGGTGIPAPAR